MVESLKFTPEEEAVLKECLYQMAIATNVSDSSEVANQFSKAFIPYMRKTIYSQDDLDLFTIKKLESDAAPEFPLAIVGPGEENDFVAYTNPGNGYIPLRTVEGDYATARIYSVANSVDWLIKHAQHKRLDIAQQALEAFLWGFKKKWAIDGWSTIIAAAADRNIMVYDAGAANGQFTKRLISLARVAMSRNGGGNVGSAGRRKLTDVFMSVEGIEETRNWNIDQIDEISRRELYLNSDGDIAKILGVRLHGMTEFGPGHQYQEFFTRVLGGTLPTGDTELAIGVDLRYIHQANFAPICRELEVFHDPGLHRHQKIGYYGWQDQGFLVTDNRNLITLSY